MTSKQRVRTAYARKKPDRVPCFGSFNTMTKSSLFDFGGSSALENIMRYLGVDSIKKVEERLGFDCGNIGPRPLPPDSERDAKLERFRLAIKDAESAEEIRKIQWPTFDMMWDYSHIKEDIESNLHVVENFAACIGGVAWDYARDIRGGIVQFFVDLMTELEITVAIFEKTYDLYMSALEYAVYKMGDFASLMDLTGGGGDFAMQDRPMFSVELFDKYFVPLFKKEKEHCKKLLPNAFYIFHCCGAVTNLIPSLVEAGVESLHPLQPGTPGMDYEKIKAQWGDKIAFCGGYDGQGTAVHGTPEDVRQMVLHAFRTLGRDGGFIFQPHGIMPEVPAENVVAMFDTVLNECWY